VGGAPVSAGALVQMNAQEGGGNFPSGRVLGVKFSD
jgi:hypothetical protein